MSRPVRVAVLSGAVLGLLLDLTVSPAEPAQVVTSLAAGCGLLVWLWTPHRGLRAQRDGRVLQLALALNLSVYALMQVHTLGPLPAAIILSLGVVAGVLVLRARDDR